MPFSVQALPDPIRIYSLPYPIYSPSVLCQTYVMGECTVFKKIDKDDDVFSSLSKTYDPRLYRVFSLHEDCPGIDHVGIVHLLSGLFSRANIPILYVTTYSYNLIFVSEESVDKAITIMKYHPQMIYSDES